jgi:hypothetical protein
MTLVEHRCPNCGAGLAPPPPAGVVRCGFCATQLSVEAGRWKARAPDAVEEPLRDPQKPRLWLGGTRYALGGRIGVGERAEVHFGWRDARVTELVVIKVAKELSSLAPEWKAVEELHASTTDGAPHFTRLLPQLVATGLARLGQHGAEGEAPVSIFRWRSGFVHSLEDVMAAYPAGIPPEHSVWMWKRMLELLGWVHRAGRVHGSLTPAHLLVHARDHGVVFTGWSKSAARTGVNGRADIAMSASCVVKALGSNRAPEPLAKLLQSPPEDAWEARDELDRAARAAFGPARYIPFKMPG